MGCSGSKSSAEAVELQAPRPHRQRRPVEVSAPTGGPVLVPPVYRDATGRPIQHSSFDLTSQTIRQALDDMAADLARQRVTIQAVTVGGAVNTLYLRSRNTTHDLDFFLANPQAPEHHALHQAARYANRQANGALGADWFNNVTQLMMPRQVQQGLAAAAFRQNTVIFERIQGGGGLRMFAAPWSYALCGKLNRLCNDNPRSYDLADAVVYLHEYLRTHGVQKVSVGKIRRWCEEYGKNVTDHVLRQLDEAYARRYGQSPIDWGR